MGVRAGGWQSPDLAARDLDSVPGVKYELEMNFNGWVGTRERPEAGEGSLSPLDCLGIAQESFSFFFFFLIKSN